MSNFMNRDGGRSGGGRFGGNRSGGKPPFAKKSWGDKGRDDRPTVMHKATCSNCGKPCEVPFRPMSGKPVYCKECFGGRGESIKETGGFPKRDFPKREFTPSARPSSTYRPDQPRFERSAENVRTDVLTKQLDAVNAKLERLIQVVEKLSLSASVERAVSTKNAETADTTPKKPKKKAAKK